MAVSANPNNENHDRFPLPRPLPRAGEGRFVSRIRDFHNEETAREQAETRQVAPITPALVSAHDQFACQAAKVARSAAESGAAAS
jgi:hypothetical protein